MTHEPWMDENRGVFMLNVLAIIFDPRTKKILIGKRVNDPFLKALSWGFPGGRPGYEKGIESYLTHEVKIKTGLEVLPTKLIFARTLPENRKFLLMYYACDIVGGSLQAGEKFSEVKWVFPRELPRFFTTSLDPVIRDYVEALGK